MINTSSTQKNKPASKDVRSDVLQKIQTKKVKQRSRSYYVFKTIIFIVGILLVFLFSVFFISLVVFIVRVNGASVLPLFGFRGIGLFFASLPWLLILLAVVFIVCIELLSRRFPISYKWPLLYSVLGTIVIITILGFVIGRPGLHERLSSFSQEHRIPIAGKIYKEQGGNPPRGSVLGTVLERTDTGFRVEMGSGEIISVHISSDTRCPHGDPSEVFTEGDAVIIMGKRNGDIIEAFGMHRFPKKHMNSKNGPPPPLQLKDFGPQRQYFFDVK